MMMSIKGWASGLKSTATKEEIMPELSHEIVTCNATARIRFRNPTVHVFTINDDGLVIGFQHEHPNETNIQHTEVSLAFSTPGDMDMLIVQLQNIRAVKSPRENGWNRY